MAQDHPLRLLERWIGEAESAGASHPASAAFVTSTAAGAPSARTVTLKRLEPEMGRQVHVSATAEWGSGELSEELFDERDVAHRWQTVVSHQGDDGGCSSETEGSGPKASWPPEGE